MVASRTRTTILYLAIGIPILHFLFESLGLREQKSFIYPPNLPPPPPGWDPSQGWDFLQQAGPQPVQQQLIAAKQPITTVKSTTTRPKTVKIEDISDESSEITETTESTSQTTDQDLHVSSVQEVEESTAASPLESDQNSQNSDYDVLLASYKKDAETFDNSDYSDPIKDEAREARKSQRLALRMALKNDEPPPDDYFDIIPDFSQKYEAYSVLASELNIRNVLPEGLEREEAPLMMVNENVPNCDPACPPDVFLNMPREWYLDTKEEEVHPISSYKYFLNPYDFCSDQKEFKLLIVVRSLPWNIDRRKVIRSTWMQDISKYQGDVKVLFYTGVDYHGGRQIMINSEAHTFGDLLQSDVTQNSANSTYHFPAIYNWIDLYCNNVIYVMNIDDTIVPFTDAIMKGPLNPPPESYGYRDFQCGKIIARPKMDQEHTYVLTGEENKAAKYTRERLPAMCFSNCMLMSRDVSRVLLYGSMTARYLNIPDMDISGITREKYSLDLPTELLAGPYLCQPVDKKMAHATEIAYDFTTVEERIAAAWEHTRDSPVAKNILKRIDFVLEKREKSRREF